MMCSSLDKALLRKLLTDACRSDTDAGNDDKLRTAVRQGMWQHVMTDAASAFADLTNIPKALVKDLQNLKY